MPPEVSVPLQVYNGAQRARRYSSSGRPYPLSASEILDWCRLMDVDLAPWEAELVFAIDDVWLAETEENLKSESKEKPDG